MEDKSNLDPWKRADLELFNVETLNLVPTGLQEEYIRIMKELAHAKAIAALALERVYLSETERHTFFDWLINTKAPEEAVCAIVIEPADTPNNITEAPLDGAPQPSASTSDYTTVVDLDEYRRTHGK